MCIDVTYYHFSNVLYSAVILAFFETMLYLFKMCYKYIKPEPMLSNHSHRHISAWFLMECQHWHSILCCDMGRFNVPNVPNIIYPACGTAPTPIQLTGYYL